MDTDVKTARRNLLVVCSVFWVYHLGDGDIGDSPKLPFVSITLGNPEAIYYLAYVMFIWLSWRYWQYASNELIRLRFEFTQKPPISRDDIQTLAHKMIESGLATPKNPDQVDVWDRLANRSDSVISGSLLRWKLNIQGFKEAENNQRNRVNEAIITKEVPLTMALRVKLKTLSAFAIRNPVLIEVILPYIAIIATAALGVWLAIPVISEVLTDRLQ